MFKKSKPRVVNREEVAVGANLLPATVLKSLGVGAAGEGKVLPPKAPCGPGAGGSGSHTVPVLHPSTNFAWVDSL